MLRTKLQFVADTLPLCAFLPHDLWIKVSFHGKSAHFDKLYDNRQSGNRILVLDICEIPGVDVDDFRQCPARQKIRSTGMGGISADDPAAIEKLQKKLDGLERSQLIMKEVNAYYRKHGKLDGCALLSPDQIEKLKASMAASWRSDPRPFESYQLTNNNAEIRRVKARIEQLSKQAQREFSGWEFDGGRVEMNREDNRLQVFFDGKPDADTRAELKSSGFRWAPSVGAWQRQLTDNAIRAADRLECIKPLSGEKPSQLQKKPSILQTMREQGEKVQMEPEKKAPSGRDAER